MSAELIRVQSIRRALEPLAYLYERMGCEPFKITFDLWCEYKALESNMQGHTAMAPLKDEYKQTHSSTWWGLRGKPR